MWASWPAQSVLSCKILSRLSGSCWVPMEPSLGGITPGGQKKGNEVLLIIPAELKLGRRWLPAAPQRFQLQASTWWEMLKGWGPATGSGVPSHTPWGHSVPFMKKRVYIYVFKAPGEARCFSSFWGTPWDSGVLQSPQQRSSLILGCGGPSWPPPHWAQHGYPDAMQPRGRGERQSRVRPCCWGTNQHPYMGSHQQREAGAGGSVPAHRINLWKGRPPQARQTLLVQHPALASRDTASPRIHQQSRVGEGKHREHRAWA